MKVPAQSPPPPPTTTPFKKNFPNTILPPPREVIKLYFFRKRCVCTGLGWVRGFRTMISY